MWGCGSPWIRSEREPVWDGQGGSARGHSGKDPVPSSGAGVRVQLARVPVLLPNDLSSARWATASPYSTASLKVGRMLRGGRLPQKPQARGPGGRAPQAKNASRWDALTQRVPQPCSISDGEETSR